MGLVESSQTLIFHFISFPSILHSVEEGKGRAEFDWYFFDIDLIRRYLIIPYDCEWYWTFKAPFILKIGIKLAFAWQSTEPERNLSIINGFGILLKSGESAKNNFFLKIAKSNHFWFHSHLSSLPYLTTSLSKNTPNHLRIRNLPSKLTSFQKFYTYILNAINGERRFFWKNPFPIFCCSLFSLFLFHTKLFFSSLWS